MRKGETAGRKPSGHPDPAMLRLYRRGRDGRVAAGGAAGSCGRRSVGGRSITGRALSSREIGGEGCFGRERRVRSTDRKVGLSGRPGIFGTVEAELPERPGISTLHTCAGHVLP